MIKERVKYKTVVISDVHLGASHSKLHEVTKFLSSVDCETLILAGDIIDGWQLKQTDDTWNVYKSAFFHVIMNMMARKGTKVVYVTGNHDDFLDAIVPCELFNIQIVSELVLQSAEKKYVVIHGHAFDSITMQFQWLAKLGDLAYNLLLKFNKIWNHARHKTGQGRYSFSQVIKHGVKKTVNLISGFEGDLADFAKAKKCDGVICGHIHHPEDKILKGGIHYLNSGDWVESLTGLVEDFEGHWKIVRYNELFK